MEKYKLFLKPSAGREIEELPTKTDRARVIARLETLAADPRPPGSEKLAGRDGFFRVRQGNYRVIYEVDDTAREITIIKVGHRRDAYR
ncbi:MAG: type II toxin-antitoxin system RelE/ParE family toxin [Planctomycetes bacterium]|nr:type II toxin-antitoxin system RelE/ParE family toxin [Planctomycetota bacterium]